MFGTMQEVLIRDTVNKFPAALGCKYKRQVLPKKTQTRVTIYVKSVQNLKKSSCYKQNKGFELDFWFG